MGPFLSCVEHLLELNARVEPSMRGAKPVRAKRVRIAVLLRLSHRNDCATNSTVSFLTNENAKLAFQEIRPGINRQFDERRAPRAAM